MLTLKAAPDGNVYLRNRRQEAVESDERVQFERGEGEAADVVRVTEQPVELTNEYPERLVVARGGRLALAVDHKLR